ncbi:hypothetical protein NPX13_g3890 [Xylaria arbuscula]|uniref:Uncharacterized protein n=1 Tax=Xylaria arbuscula TaxID=114810 RepID=A0A9W8NGW5_9PEZI|nr:hypothetical protein NPX13_g3890 [Xylaria arbuscula]
MKYTSQTSDRLSQARMIIDEQSTKITALEKEIAILRGTTPGRAPTPKLASKPIQSPLSSPCYAFSTASSRGKKQLPEKTTEGERPRVIRISGQQYTYRNGVPSRFDDCVTHNYLVPTAASKQREEIIETERTERLKKAALLASKQPPTPVSQDSHDSEDSTWASWSESLDTSDQPGGSFPPTPPSSARGFPDGTETPGNGLIEKTRVNDSLEESTQLDIIRTESRTNLSYLQKAVSIVQNSIWDSWMNDRLVGWQRWKYVDGPHLIALGRDELHQWINRHDTMHLAQNGYRGYEVYNAIIAVVPMRNVMSHPNSHELRNPFLIDMLLHKAQFLCVVLGDERSAMELRDL